MAIKLTNTTRKGTENKMAKLERLKKTDKNEFYAYHREGGVTL